MRRPVPDVLLRRGTARTNPVKVSSTEPVSRDRRWDNPCPLVGYSRNLGWNFTQTALDDPERAAYVDALCKRYRH